VHDKLRRRGRWRLCTDLLTCNVKSTLKMILIILSIDISSASKSMSDLNKIATERSLVSQVSEKAEERMVMTRT
jgi:hypothetical protein